VADPARHIQSLLEKLTADEKDAFNFLVGLARQQPSVPRSYTVTLQYWDHEHKGTRNVMLVPVQTERVVWAYNWDEAMKQMQLALERELPGNPAHSRARIHAITPTRPEGTE